MWSICRKVLNIKNGAAMKIRRELYMIGVRPQSVKDLKRTNRTVMKLMNSSLRKPFWTNTDNDEVINPKINMPFL
jgi:hypothetical protein